MAAFVIAVVVSAAPAGASGPYEIFNFGSNQCLQPVNRSTDQGAAIVQEPCNGGAAQQWMEISVGNNIFRYKNVLSGLCLDARGRPKNGTPVQQWTCNRISNKSWQPGEYMPDYIPPLISRVSGTNNYCLDIPGAHQPPGLAMQIYRRNGTGEGQQWWIAPSVIFHKTIIRKGSK